MRRNRGALSGRNRFGSKKVRPFFLLVFSRGEGYVSCSFWGFG